jgi:hypothetical protein
MQRGIALSAELLNAKSTQMCTSSSCNVDLKLKYIQYPPSVRMKMYTHLDKDAALELQTRVLRQCGQIAGCISCLMLQRLVQYKIDMVHCPRTTGHRLNQFHS